MDEAAHDVGRSLLGRGGSPDEPLELAWPMSRGERRRAEWRNHQTRQTEEVTGKERGIVEGAGGRE